MFQYMILPFKRYFDFRGRSRRMEYWAFALFNFIIAFLIIAVMLAGGASLGAFAELEAGNAEPLAGMFAGGFGLVFLLYAAAVIIPGIAVVIRRLHDRDMSGWWYLGLIVASMIPIVNFIASIAFLVLMLLPGTPGPNRFGPDPKDPTSAGVFS